MKETKYLMSGGLAFTEKKDMEKLHQWSLKGWHVSSFAFMGYTLEKGENEEYIYSVDYHTLKEEDQDEYLDFFAASGWSRVASQGNVHLFRAKANTKPIYSDKDTTSEKYQHSATGLSLFAWPLLLITLLSWTSVGIISETFQPYARGLSVFLTILAIPALFTWIATYYQLLKLKEKKVLANCLLLVPFLLVVIAVGLLIITDNTSWRTFASMIIGAIAFPSLIWFVMYLYHRMKWSDTR